MSGIFVQGPLFVVCLVFMLGIVVVIHELGHYLAGRYFGAAAESFSVGFGQSIFERKDSRGTRWRLNWIPIGGFVKFVGEGQLPGDVGKVEHGPVGKPFQELSVGARSIVALAGPVANFVLAVIIFTIILLANGSARQEVYVASAAPGGAAIEAGLQSGDQIVSINGAAIADSRDVLVPVQLSSGTALEMGIVRDGVPQTLMITPKRQMRENGIGQQQALGTIGIRMDVKNLPRKQYNPASALVAGIGETGETIGMTVSMIGRIATGREPLNQLSGPVGIGDVTRRVFNQTMAIESVSLTDRIIAVAWTMLQICALVSVGIGLFNLLPLPVLDGGHLLFNAYEAVMGRALPEKIQEASLTGGLILLLGIAAFVTWGDVLETGVFGGSNG